MPGLLIATGAANSVEKAHLPLTAVRLLALRARLVRLLTKGQQSAQVVNPGSMIPMETQGPHVLLAREVL